MKTLPALSNVDIDAYFKKNKKYGGCISKDDLLLTRAKKANFYVLNMDTPEGNGTHWIALYNMNKNGVFYFDSFGAPPAEHVLSFMRATGKPMFYSDLVLQDFNASSCGFFCIYMLQQLLKGRSIEDILLSDFTLDPKQNEKKLLKYFVK